MMSNKSVPSLKIKHDLKRVVDADEGESNILPQSYQPLPKRNNLFVSDSIKMNAIDNKNGINKTKKVTEWKDSIDNIIGEFDKL